MKEQKLHQGHFGKKPQKAVKSGQYSKTGDIAKISHAAKLHSKISHAVKILCNFQFPSVFSSNCYLLYPCSYELGSGSSHLNWLEESGTIGLQNYKNIHKI